jgi:hypothetical protein
MKNLKHIVLYQSRDAVELALLIDQAMENPNLEIKAVWCGATADQTAVHFAILGVKPAASVPPQPPPQHGGRRR